MFCFFFLLFLFLLIFLFLIFLLLIFLFFFCFYLFFFIRHTVLWRAIYVADLLSGDLLVDDLKYGNSDVLAFYTLGGFVCPSCVFYWFLSAPSVRQFFSHVGHGKDFHEFSLDMDF